MRHRPRARGVTLVELMISLVVIITGLLVVFRAIGVSVAGSSTSSRVSQAQVRAAAIIEAIRLAPDNALTCLRNTPVVNWSTCEALCYSLQTGGATASRSSCIFTTDSFQYVPGPSAGVATQYADQRNDRLGQSYLLNATGAPALATDPAKYASTYVRQVGDGLRTWEAVVTVSWNDDNSNRVAPFPDHSVTLATGIFK